MWEHGSTFLRVVEPCDQVFAELGCGSPYEFGWVVAPAPSGAVCKGVEGAVFGGALVGDGDVVECGVSGPCCRVLGGGEADAVVGIRDAS